MLGKRRGQRLEGPTNVAYGRVWADLSYTQERQGRGAILWKRRLYVFKEGSQIRHREDFLKNIIFY